MKKYYFYLLLLALLSISYSLRAKESELILTVSSNEISVGDKIELALESSKNLDTYAAPNINGFKLVGGPNTSRSSSWINGKTSNTFKISYFLVATKQGNFKMGPFKASVNGKPITSNSLTVKVNKSSSTTDKSVTNKQIFIKASVNKTKCYIGEQLILTYDLYFRVNVSNLSIDKDAKMSGFWTQPLEDIPQNQRTKVVNGLKWNVITIRKTMLSPIKSGKLKIDPLKLTCVVAEQVSGGGFFGFGRVVEKERNIASNTINLKVTPLPKNGVPESFDGQVGKYKIKATISKKELKVNESLDIKITISGSGNIGLIDNLPLSLPQDFETYDPKISDNIKNTLSGSKGSRTFSYLAIPRNAGKFEIPATTFSYFDISKNKYTTIQTSPMTINVLKLDGKESEDTYTVSSSNKRTIEILDSDIRYLHKITINKKNTPWFKVGGVGFIAIHLVYSAILLSLFIFARKRKQLYSNKTKLNKKMAGKITKKFLLNAQDSLNKKDKTSFYENLSKAIYGYVSYKFSIPISELDKDNIKSVLLKNNISEAPTNELIAVITECEMARFSPANTSIDDLFEKTENIIVSLEKKT